MNIINKNINIIYHKIIEYIIKNYHKKINNIINDEDIFYLLYSVNENELKNEIDDIEKEFNNIIKKLNLNYYFVYVDKDNIYDELRKNKNIKNYKKYIVFNITHVSTNRISLSFEEFIFFEDLLILKHIIKDENQNFIFIINKNNRWFNINDPDLIENFKLEYRDNLIGKYIEKLNKIYNNNLKLLNKEFNKNIFKNYNENN